MEALPSNELNILFPLSPFKCRILTTMNIVLTQLHPNDWALALILGFSLLKNFCSWLTFVVFVRIDGFKLEGGELFKEGFRKLLSQEWNSLKKTIDKEFSLPKKQAKAAVPEKQSVASHKESVLYTSKQQTKLNLKRLRIERLHTEVYTSSLKTHSYILSSQKPWGNPLSNHTLITYTTTKKVTLIPSRHTLLGQHTNTKIADLDPLKNTQSISANT